MIDGKLLALAFNNKNAPAELVTAAKSHMGNLQAIDKLNSQIENARSALVAAKQSAQDSEEVLSKLLNQWDPNVTVKA